MGLAHTLTEDAALPSRGAEHLPGALLPLADLLGGEPTPATVQRQGEVPIGNGHAGQPRRVLARPPAA